MNLKIENQLDDSAYAKLIETLENGLVDSITFFQGLRYESVQVEKLVISVEEVGYSIDTRIFFRDPIGTTVCEKAGIKERGLKKSPTYLRLNVQRSAVDPETLIADIEYSLLLVEKVANYACKIHGEYKTDVFSVDSNFIDQQLAEDEARKTRELRGERAEPFAIIHADSGFDLNTLSADLVPIYKEFDRWDLFGGKKTYQLLPRNLVLKLLKCQGPTLIPEDQFNEEEREVLRDLSKKRHIKFTEIAGKIYYFDLDARTIMYLNKALRRKNF